MTSSIDMPAKN